MSGRRLERLGPNHQLGGFQSGNESLDRWAQVHALASQQMDVARTFVLVGGERVLGYFSLTMGSVHRAEAPPALVRGLPGYPVGMVLLARLAVDARVQGQNLGSLLLAEALRKAVVPARPLPPGSSWWTPSTRPRPASTSITASSSSPSIPFGSTVG